jgi:hypothetical protein
LFGGLSLRRLTEFAVRHFFEKVPAKDNSVGSHPLVGVADRQRIAAPLPFFQVGNVEFLHAGATDKIIAFLKISGRAAGLAGIDDDAYSIVGSLDGEDLGPPVADLEGIKNSCGGHIPQPDDYVAIDGKFRLRGLRQ